MRLRLFALFVVLLFASRLPAQTVQLPEFRFFGTSTTVMVPDQGGVMMGGVNRASSGQVEFGGIPGLRSRAFGNELSSAKTSVHVQIHDFEAMDEALLQEAAARRAARGDGPVVGRPAFVFNRAAQSTVVRSAEPRQPELPSVEELKRRHADRLADAQREARDYLERAQSAQSAGKANVARIFYQMAARHATGPLKDQILAEARQLDKARSTSLTSAGDR